MFVFIEWEEKRRNKCPQLKWMLIQKTPVCVVINDSTEHNKSIQIKSKQTNKTKLNKNTKSKWTYQFVKNQK